MYDQGTTQLAPTQLAPVLTRPSLNSPHTQLALDFGASYVYQYTTRPKVLCYSIRPRHKIELSFFYFNLKRFYNEF